MLFDRINLPRRVLGLVHVDNVVLDTETEFAERRAFGDLAVPFLDLACRVVLADLARSHRSKHIPPQRASKYDRRMPPLDQLPAHQAPTVLQQPVLVDGDPLLEVIPDLVGESVGITHPGELDSAGSLCLPQSLDLVRVLDFGTDKSPPALDSHCRTLDQSTGI